VTGLFPGAVGVSRLRVYTDRAIDGLPGGSPHLHTVCSEGYLVTGGNGRVQTLTLGEGFRETRLVPGTLVWFDPGTVHRLVNDGDLELVVIMQNSGLPEAGDAVLTFPDAHVSDPAGYSDAASIAGPGPASRLAAAMARRDLAVEGFSLLRDAAASGDPDRLLRFHARAAALVSAHTATWRERWRAGAWASARTTSRQLDAIAVADTAHFADAAVRGAEPVERLGMCGWLHAY